MFIFFPVFFLCEYHGASTYSHNKVHNLLVSCCDHDVHYLDELNVVPVYF